MREQWKIYAKKADFNKIAQQYGITPVLPRCITKSSLSMSINMRIGRGAAIYAVNFKPLFQIFYNFARVNP